MKLEEVTETDVHKAQTRGGPSSLLLVVAVVFALVLGAVGGVLLIRPETEPSDTSPEAGFARDMSVHHAQAVQMAFMVYTNTEDEEIRQLAYDIINTQRAQIGMFSGWLEQWDLPQTTLRPPMQWADHAHDETITSYDDMPGMATDDQLAELENASGVEAERLYLELMIAHHRGGIEMAEAVIPLTERDEVQRLAQGIVDGQTSEIDYMQELLAERQPAAQ